MPTGYTCDIAKDISFNQFVMNCARAFGACIEMRDDPMDKPIPKEFKPTSYHKKSLETAQKQMEKLLNMTPEQMARAAKREYKQEIKSTDEYIEEKKVLEAKYTAMLDKVVLWEPPSKEHHELKKFMIEQITGSIDFDCKLDYWIEKRNKIVELSVKEWLAKEKKRIQWDIDYHTKEQKEEEERASGRTMWIKQLRESLKGKGDNNG